MNKKLFLGKKVRDTIQMSCTNRDLTTDEEVLHNQDEQQRTHRRLVAVNKQSPRHRRYKKSAQMNRLIGKKKLLSLTKNRA